MDIRPVTNAYGAKPYQPSAKSGKKEAPEKAAAVPKEQVEFSSISQNIQTLREAVDTFPDVRIDVVEEIRTKIKYNGYPLESNLYKAIENLVHDKIL